MLEQDRIIKINIEEEMKSSYIDYSMSVIVSRALPDVRDGFKPVHRRILFGMMGLGNTSDKPYKKSARVVGEPDSRAPCQQVRRGADRGHHNRGSPPAHRQTSACTEAG